MPYVDVEKGREYARLWMREHRRANPEECHESRKSWDEKNRERVRETKRAWVLANPEKVIASNIRKAKRRRERYAANIEKARATANALRKANAARIAEWGRASRARLHEETINAYGGACAICGESDFAKLTIDHANGDGGEFRRPFHERGVRMSGHYFYRWLKVRGFPKNLGLRVLCKPCNSREGRKYKREMGKGALAADRVAS